MNNDFWLGATWMLGCIFAGVLITLIFVAVLGDQAPDVWDWPPDDPRWDEPGPSDHGYVDENAEHWLREHTLHEFPEVNLMEEGKVIQL